ETVAPGSARGTLFETARLLRADGVAPPSIRGPRGPGAGGPVLDVEHPFRLGRVVPGDGVLVERVAGGGRSVQVREEVGVVEVGVGDQDAPHPVAGDAVAGNRVVGRVVGEHEPALPVAADGVVRERAAGRVGNVYPLAQVVAAVVVADG